MPESQKTDVNYDAVNVAPQGGPHNPYDDALAFRSLLGAVHGEFERTVNANMVSESNTLKKVNGRAILEKGVKELMGKKPDQNILPVIDPQQQVTQPKPKETWFPSESYGLNHTQPLQQPIVPNTIQETNTNNEQMEFNFDNTATAQSIFDKLDDIEIRLNNLTKLVENLQKKPSVKKTATKKK